MKKPTITVIGSINMDMVTTTDQVPDQGETVLGKAFQTVHGGKGANQAVAAARLGADVHMIGRVGDDPFGSVLKDGLEVEGVSTSCVEPVTHKSSGVASIILSNQDNRIIVTPGANNDVTPEYVQQFLDVITYSDVVLLQFEIPLKTVEYVLQLCEEHGVPVIVNPAPAQQLKLESWLKATCITPNESEKSQLFSDSIDSPLLEKLIVTKGNAGAVYYERDKEIQVSSFDVSPVDTTGAGDTFNGAFAFAIAQSMPKQKALLFANAAAALSVGKFGAQGGMPTLKEVETFMTERGADK